MEIPKQVALHLGRQQIKPLMHTHKEEKNVGENGKGIHSVHQITANHTAPEHCVNAEVREDVACVEIA